MYKEVDKSSNIVNDDLQIDLQYSVNLSKDPDTNKGTKKVLSLFSGCGGLDLGFEGSIEVHKTSINEKLNKSWIESRNGDFVTLKKNPFKTIFANDISKDAKTAWIKYFNKKYHLPIDTYKHASIVDLVKLHKAGVAQFPDDIDIVTGGFPCQDFSLAGKRKGFNSHKSHDGKLAKPDLPTIETRGQLYIWMKEVVDITLPKMFIAENVKGLVNLENVKEIIQSDFEKAGNDGYIVLSPKVLHAANYGVPQSRERVIFIGLKKSAIRENVIPQILNGVLPESLSPYPKKTHGNHTNEDSDLVPTVKLKDIFEHLLEPEEEKSDLSQMKYSKARYMGKHCQGQTEVKLNSIGPTIRAEHHGNIEFRRLSQSNGGKYLEELKRGKIERRLTLRECALIQTFPRDFEFVITDSNKKGKYLLSPSQGYKLIGNAVPPLLGYHIAKRVETVWSKIFK